MCQGKEVGQVSTPYGVFVCGPLPKLVAPFVLRNLTRNLSLLGRYVFPPDVLRKISSRITNEVGGINRVTYDVSSKPPAVSFTLRDLDWGSSSVKL